MPMPEILPNWHPIVVHFAIGLLLTAAILFVLGALLSSRPLGAAATAAARLDLGLGLGAALVALATGWQAYNSVAHDAQSHVNMTIHMKWAFATVALFVVAGAAAWFDRRRPAGAGPAVLAAIAIASGSLVATGWLGGENVYRYGLGVMSLPKDDGHDHAGHHHHHDEAEEATVPATDASKHSDGHGAPDLGPDHEDAPNAGQGDRP